MFRMSLLGTLLVALLIVFLLQIWNEVVFVVNSKKFRFQFQFLCLLFFILFYSATTESLWFFLLCWWWCYSQYTMYGYGMFNFPLEHNYSERTAHIIFYHFFCHAFPHKLSWTKNSTTTDKTITYNKRS